MIAFRAQKKVGPRPHWSPLRVSFKISDEHPRVFGLLSSRNFASIGALITLGTRGFSRVRREFSVLTEGRDIFGRRPKSQAAIKTWQKPETVLEKSLAPRVCPHLLAKFESGNKEDMSRGNCCFTSMLCLSHKNIDKKVGRSVGWWKLIFFLCYTTRVLTLPTSTELLTLLEAVTIVVDSPLSWRKMLQLAYHTLLFFFPASIPS